MSYEIREIIEADIGMNQKCGKKYWGPVLKQDDHDDLTIVKNRIYLTCNQKNMISVFQLLL